MNLAILAFLVLFCFAIFYMIRAFHRAGSAHKKPVKRWQDWDDFGGYDDRD